MDVLRMNSYTYSVAIVPCIGGVHEDIIAIIGAHCEVVMIALKENEIDFAGERAFVFIVMQIYLVKIYGDGHFIAYSKLLCYGFGDIPIST